MTGLGLRNPRNQISAPALFRAGCGRQNSTYGSGDHPTGVRRQVGLSQGDLVDLAYSRGKIVITPKLVTDRSQFPNTDDEYTPEQRRVIDAELREAGKGPFSGPFRNGDEVAAFLTRARIARPQKTSEFR